MGIWITEDSQGGTAAPIRAESKDTSLVHWYRVGDGSATSFSNGIADNLTFVDTFVAADYSVWCVYICACTLNYLAFVRSGGCRSVHALAFMGNFAFIQSGGRV
jgi:hypothetical protein